jgi:hypothetical protein
MPIVVPLFTRRGWDDGFYKVIGGRQIVQQAVDEAIMFERDANKTSSCIRLIGRNYGTSPGDCYGKPADREFNQALQVFAARIENFNTRGGLLDLMSHDLQFERNKLGYDDPYDWGNPTPWTAQTYGDFFGALKNDISYPQKKIGERDIYFRNGKLDKHPVAVNGVYPGAYFILTHRQQDSWCKKSSCVAP